LAGVKISGAVEKGLLTGFTGLTRLQKNRIAANFLNPVNLRVFLCISTPSSKFVCYFEVNVGDRKEAQADQG